MKKKNYFAEQVEFNNFIYRQKQRLVYHFTNNPVAKQIAEINRFSEHIRCLEKNYFIKKLSLHLPRNSFDYIFLRFDLFVSNAERLGGKYKVKDNRLLFSWDDFKVHITNAGDLHIINEIFVEKCYQFRLPGNNHVNVIDIGMNVGLASLYFASLPFVDKVFSFEPFKPTFDLAVNNFSLNPAYSPKIKAYNYGLGDKSNTIILRYDPDNPGINKTHGANSKNHKSPIQEQVHIKTALEEINRIIENQKGIKFLIKLDTEGSEYEILENLFSQDLDPKIIGFIIEWHDKGSKDIEEMLLREKFQLFSFWSNKTTGLIYGFKQER